ncbi:class I SAM-dependent methyltransferase family protein [Candidatus Woesearchaeota archaeon]|nr:class I SAM-dependent methyltransferase family protein [Candidatus Woesearchaeota archaeon]
MKLRDVLKGKLTEREFSKLKTAHDIVGDIAILEIPRGLEKKEKYIADALLKLNKHIKTVLKKKGGHIGELRLQKYKILAGEKRKETIHKELGVRVTLHLEKTYFSPRLVTERKSIMEQIKPGEEILVMFSGIGIYPLVFARNTRAKEIIGIELNPAAHQYGLENVKMNKAKNVVLLQGDVRNVMPKLKRKFDRIVMPLPMGAEHFLDLALEKIKNKGIIHFYDFLMEEEIPEKAFEKIQEACKKAGKKYKIISWRKCGSAAPRKYRVCVDARILGQRKNGSASGRV